MATAEWIRGASFEEVWAQVIDPLLLLALGDPDGSSMAAAAAEVLTLWLLRGAGCRYGDADAGPKNVERRSTKARTLGASRPPGGVTA